MAGKIFFLLSYWDEKKRFIPGYRLSRLEIFKLKKLTFLHLGRNFFRTHCQTLNFSPKKRNMYHHFKFKTLYSKMYVGFFSDFTQSSFSRKGKIPVNEII